MFFKGGSHYEGKFVKGQIMENGSQYGVSTGELVITHH